MTGFRTSTYTLTLHAQAGPVDGLAKNVPLLPPTFQPALWVPIPRSRPSVGSIFPSNGLSKLKPIHLKTLQRWRYGGRKQDVVHGIATATPARRSGWFLAVRTGFPRFMVEALER